ncbi:hypothetical protein Tco_0952262 [Tanacetum coccineum]|uniref:Uncharacterized protein n=1 Tax=Tanacetum coccineum TaxID=301880 RepID=A0ABQ5DYU2_9ASTR
MKKTMLKQQFAEFSVTEEEGLHKGYDRFQKILSQLNQVQARPDNDDINLKFLRALPSSWLISWRRKKWTYKANGYAHLRLTVLKRRARTKMNYNNSATCQILTEGKLGVTNVFNWEHFARSDSEDNHAAENKTGEVEKVYGMMAGLHADNGGAGISNAADEFAMMGISPKAYQHAVKTLESQKDWYHKTQIALEEKIRVLSANLENTTNTLSYTEKLHDQAQNEKKEWEVKYEATLARFDKWKESSKNLKKLINSSTRLNLFTQVLQAGEMHVVPPPITGTYMPSPYQSDIEETQVMTSLQTQRPMHPVIQASRPRPKTSPCCDIQTLPETDLKTKFHYCSPRFSYSVPCKSKATYVSTVRRNSSASVTADESDPAASRNRPAVTSAGRPVSAGWLNPAARPSSVHFNTMYWPTVYEPMYMHNGRRGTAVKTSACYSWRNKRPQFWGSKSNGGSHQSTWFHT